MTRQEKRTAIFGAATLFMTAAYYFGREKYEAANMALTTLFLVLTIAEMMEDDK